MVVAMDTFNMCHSSCESVSFTVPYTERWKEMRAVLAAAWEVSARKPRLLEAALGHALDFQTWHSLVRQRGLDDEQASDLMVGMVCCLVAGE
jgi:alkylhydroperoxidase family enzyme